jgi:hypothetical protein
MDKSEAARVLAQSRPITERVCPVCGKTFMGSGRGLYDSRSCRAKAYRATKRTQPKERASA